MFTRVGDFLGQRTVKSKSAESELLNSAPNVDELEAEIAKLNQRIKSSQWEKENLKGEKQSAERQAKLFAKNKQAAEKEAEDLRKALMETEVELQISQKARLCADEQSRRLSELLENALETTALIRKENNILTSNIANLQTGIERLTDDQVVQSMNVLYHDLEKWIMGYSNDPSVLPGYGFSKPSEGKLTQIQSWISNSIHHSYWARFFVGLGTADHFTMDMNKVIVETCPSHVAHHWRYGMSVSGLKLRREDLKFQCDLIIHQLQIIWPWEFTTREGRRNQLTDLISRCVIFKHKLEYQEETYIFRVSVPGMEFRPNTMRSPTNDGTAGDIIECSLWPAIYKVLATGRWEIVAKEIVKIAPAIVLQQQMTRQTEGPLPEDQMSLI